MRLGPLGPLFRHHWLRHRLPLLPMAVGLALFEFMITRMAPSPNEATWMTRLLATVPPKLMALAGSEFAATPAGVLAIGYGHPFFVLLLSVWAVRVSSGAVAGEIGRGTMDLLAARPVPRWHHVAAGFATIAAGLGLLLAVVWGTTALGLGLRQLGVGAPEFLRVAAGAWLLFTAWGSVGLLVGATLREGGPAIAWTSGLIAVSFVLDYLARLWTPIAGLRPLSLFRYYEPLLIHNTGLAASSVLVLGAVAALALAGSVVVLRLRDL